MAKRYYRIETGEYSSGVDVTYDSKERMVTLGGHYDSIVGIAPETLPVVTFLEMLGLTPKRVQKLWEERDD